MSDESEYDLIVIGGGPAGYAAAIRTGQLGKRVVCVERERAGGTCLNWGCIPSKTLLKTAELYASMRHADAFGISCSELTFDFEAVIQRSRNVADRMGGGIEFLFRKNRVEYLLGTGRIASPGVVEVSGGEGGDRLLRGQRVLVSTGCRARRLPHLKVDGERVMTSREALVMKRLPGSIAIVGAGAIGVEFAYFLNALGSKVTLIEMLPEIVPVEDKEVSRTLARAFKKQGIAIHTETTVENIKPAKQSVSFELCKGEERRRVRVESVLLSIGVEANLEGLISDNIDLELDSGFVAVDDRYRTNVGGIYAAGDVIGPPWLAHVATFEAIEAVNGMFTNSEPRKVGRFPGCTYCQPQVASVGLTEEAARARGLKIRLGKFPFTASGKAVAVNHIEGFVKLILDEQYGEILGAHIIGPDATELIAEYVLAMECEITAHEIHRTIHAHPTLSEALSEAAASAYGEAIHI